MSFEPFGKPVQVIPPAAPLPRAPSAPSKRPRIEERVTLAPAGAPAVTAPRPAAKPKPKPQPPAATPKSPTAPEEHGRGKRGFRGDIEGLRAVAVLLVVFNHVTDWPHGGYIGVDIFFVISGYLITGLLVGERERTGRISFRGFYARRVRRLMPAGILCLIATDIAAHQIFLHTRAHQTYTDSIWSLFFLANVHFSQIGTNYFDHTRPPSPFQHYWSLSVEEQFYLVWPWLILGSYFVAKKLRITGSRMVKLVGAAAAVVSLVWCVWSTRHNATAAYFSSPARAWELGLGAVVAMNQARLLKISAALRSAVGWLAVAVIAVSAVVISDTTEWPGYAAVAPVAATAVLLGAAASSAGGPGSAWALGNPVFRFVGRISYSVYLWHWPIFIYATAFYAPKSTKLYVVVFGLSAVVSVLSYYLIEQPGQKLRRGSFTQWQRARRSSPVRRQQPTVAFVAAGVVVLLVAGYLFHRSSGTPAATAAAPDGGVPSAAATPAALDSASAAPTDPLLAQQEALVTAALASKNFPDTLTPSLDDITTAGAPEWFTDKCLDVTTAAAVAHCTYGPAGAAHHAVLIGDSFGISWMPAIRKALPAGWDVTALTLGQCPVTSAAVLQNNVHFTGCDTHHAFVLDQLAKIKPDLVIAGDSYASLYNMGGGTLAAHADAVKTGLVDYLGKVKALAKNVVTLGAPPGSGNLQSCATRFNSVSSCLKIYGSSWQTWNTVEQQVAQTERTTFVDTESWFCAATKCPAVLGSTPVYFDGDHLTAAMAQKLAPLVGEALKPAL